MIVELTDKKIDLIIEAIDIVEHADMLQPDMDAIRKELLKLRGM